MNDDNEKLLALPLWVLLVYRCIATMCSAAEVPKRMPLQRRVPKHDYAGLGDVPQWLQDKENRAYEAYAKNPPPGHKPLEEAGFRLAAWTMCSCYSMPSGGLEMAVQAHFCHRLRPRGTGDILAMDLPKCCSKELQSIQKEGDPESEPDLQELHKFF